MQVLVLTHAAEFADGRWAVADHFGFEDREVGLRDGRRVVLRVGGSDDAKARFRQADGSLVDDLAMALVMG